MDLKCPNACQPVAEGAKLASRVFRIPRIDLSGQAERAVRIGFARDDQAGPGDDRLSTLTVPIDDRTRLESDRPGTRQLGIEVIQIE